MPARSKSTAKTEATRKTIKSTTNVAKGSPKRPAASPSSPKPQQVKKALKQHLKSSEAVANFPALVRQVLKTKERVYVKDKAGRSFMTIDPVKRFVEEPLIPIGVQTLKDNFSACSALIKRGFAFVVRSRGSAAQVYVRRHQSYQDPLDPVIDAWRQQVLAPMISKALEPFVATLSSLKLAPNNQEAHNRPSIDEFNKSINDLKGALKLAADRIFIGHHPFREGQIHSATRGGHTADEDDLSALQ